MKFKKTAGLLLILLLIIPCTGTLGYYAGYSSGASKYKKVLNEMKTQLEKAKEQLSKKDTDYSRKTETAAENKVNIEKHEIIRTVIKTTEKTNTTKNNQYQHVLMPFPRKETGSQNNHTVNPPPNQETGNKEQDNNSNGSNSENNTPVPDRNNPESQPSAPVEIITDLSIEVSKTRILVDEPVMLTVKATTNTGKTITNPEGVQFTTSAGTIANGRFICDKPGWVTITVRYGNIERSIQIRVVGVVDLVIETSANRVLVGKPLPITVKAVTEDGEELTSLPGIELFVSNGSLVDGQLVCDTPGWVTVTARYKDIEKSIQIRVSYVASLRVETPSDRVYVGQKLPVTVRAVTDTGEEFEPPDAVVNTTLGTVSNGEFTSNTAGTAMITATFEGLEASVQVKVVGITELKIEVPKDHVLQYQPLPVTVKAVTDEGETIDALPGTEITASMGEIIDGQFFCGTPGWATITARYLDVEGSIRIGVTDGNVSKFVITAEGKYDLVDGFNLIQWGEPVEFRVFTAVDANGVPVDIDLFRLTITGINAEPGVTYPWSAAGQGLFVFEPTIDCRGTIYYVQGKYNNPNGTTVRSENVLTFLPADRSVKRLTGLTDYVYWRPSGKSVSFTPYIRAVGISGDGAVRCYGYAEFTFSNNVQVVLKTSNATLDTSRNTVVFNHSFGKLCNPVGFSYVGDIKLNITGNSFDYAFRVYEKTNEGYKIIYEEANTVPVFESDSPSPLQLRILDVLRPNGEQVNSLSTTSWVLPSAPGNEFYIVADVRNIAGEKVNVIPRISFDIPSRNTSGTIDYPLAPIYASRHDKNLNKDFDFERDSEKTEYVFRIVDHWFAVPDNQISCEIVLTLSTVPYFNNSDNNQYYSQNLASTRIYLQRVDNSQAVLLLVGPKQETITTKTGTTVNFIGTCKFYAGEYGQPILLGCGYYNSTSYPPEVIFLHNLFDPFKTIRSMKVYDQYGNLISSQTNVYLSLVNYTFTSPGAYRVVIEFNTSYVAIEPSRVEFTVVVQS